MKEHPLTLEDLEQERQYLKESGFRLIAIFERDALVVAVQQARLRAGVRRVAAR
jgi:hypothetical protein